MTFRFRLSALTLALLSCALLCAAQSPVEQQSPPEGRQPGSMQETAAASSAATFPIPGPLRPFLRMSGISQQVSLDTVLPSLSWTVANLGFEGTDRPTEFLVLLRRYVVQSRELAELAGSAGVIRVSNCNDAKPLLRILGYRVSAHCGDHEALLLTADAERAFLTVDSGFPLTELEQTLAGGQPFEYAYPSTQIPVLFGESDWTTASTKNHVEHSKDLLDTILNDRAIARLYWALSRMDPDTGRYLSHTVGIRKLLPYAPLLDFYGNHICIRGGHVLVPGGPVREAAWKDLTGADPAAPSEFILTLLSKDQGWMVAYFDVLSIVNRKQQEILTQSPRLRRIYTSLRPSDKSVNAAKGVFRPSPWLLLLADQVRWDESGQPTIPGGIEVWREILARNKQSSRTLHEKYKDKNRLRTPDELLEAMFALSRRESEINPLQAYLVLVDLDSRRPAGRPLSADTVRLMSAKFPDYSDQYRIFTEFPELTDASIALFLDSAEQLLKTPTSVRGNALGTIQANLGLWQILARQKQISSAQMDDSFQNVIKPFSRIHTANQLYDAGRASLSQLARATTGKNSVSQDDIIELLAGPRQSTPEGKKIHVEVADRIRSVLNGQRLVSLDTLTALGDGLNEKANGKPPAEYLFYLADELHAFEMPQPMFSKNEREEWAAGVYNNHHTDLQMRSSVGEVLKSTKATRPQIEEARGQLTSFLRDSLVGLNYAYYEPPGAQALHANPLFVRSHDFAGESVEGIKAVWQAPQLFGEGYPAGGGAHLVGSLADLPYVLAEIEQDFMAPKNIQALIWNELVPSLLTSAVLPRWWGVSPNELHAVTLYQQAGEELLVSSCNDKELRAKVMAILSDRILPRRYEEIEQALADGQVSNLIPKLMPADTFYLAAEFEQRYPAEGASSSSAGKELRRLHAQHPEEVSWKRISQDFGVPHPTLRHTYARELLNVPPLPAFSGYASRLLGESWDSSNLYWARIADETGHPPADLNRLVPDLTQRMVEKTFATDFEDWPAILRAMRETGEEFRAGKTAVVAQAQGHQ